MRYITVFAALMVMASCPLAQEEAASADWSSYAGNGQYQPPCEGLKLILNPKDAKVAWLHKEHTGIGKSSSKLPKALAEAGITAFYGGCTSLIVADGIVFASYFRPTGDVLNEKSENRYFKDPAAQLKSLRQIDADDVLLAIDAENGKLLWRAEEKGKGLNFLSAKRGHYGVTPAYHTGIVFSFGATGRIYAYKAKTGEKLWKSNNGEWHRRAEEAKNQALAEKRIPDLYAGGKNLANLFQYRQPGMIVVEGVLVVPTMTDGIAGFDPETGNEIWRREKILSMRSTPALWHYESRTYLLTGKGGGTTGSVHAIDPKDGKVLWSLEEGLGPNRGALVVGQGHVLLNTRGNLNMGQKGPKDDKKAATGLFACYRLTLEGPKKVWTVPDEERFWHPVRKDRGCNRFAGAIRDNVVVVALGAGKEDRSLCTFNLESGKLIDSVKHTLSCVTSPYVVEDRIFVHRDTAHSGNGAAFHVYSISKEGRLKDLGEVSFQDDLKIQMMTAYEIQMETPYYKGMFYTKTDKGIVAIDVRQK